MINECKKLLVQAVKKQLELNQTDEWKMELLEKAHPILWFGNMLSSKPKIVTIGANPSREEFLAINREEATKIINIEKQLDYSHFLQGKKRRFRALNSGESLVDVLKDDNLQNEIVESYNRYFYKKSNPYGKWFGRNGKIEGFLNGMDASYYEKVEHSYTAIHTDFFPLPTVSDFNDVKSIVSRDLFNNNWSQNFLKETLEVLNPKVIIIFGSTNTKVFKKLFSKELYELSANKFSTITKRDEYSFYKYKNKYLVIMVSTYLANPIGVTAEQLNKMGQEVRSTIEKIKI